MLSILSKIFGYFVRRRAARFDSGAEPAKNVGLPVISVGNLSMGGTGKTPMIAALCELIIEMGYRPGIIGRGYKKKQRGTVIVSDGKAILSDARRAGDEMLMLARKCRVPVIADEIKSRAAEEMARRFRPDCIIVDDGFQHRRLHRDLDFVILDQATIDAPFLFPNGRLREPLSALGRANAVFVPKGTALSDEAKEYIPQDIPIIQFNTRAMDIELACPESETFERPSWASPSIAFSGIANPQRFAKSLAQNGIRIDGLLPFADHQAYSERDIRKIIKFAKKHNANSIFTTEKDRVKISEYFDIFVNEGLKCFVLPIETDFGNAKDDVINLLKKKLMK